MFVCVVDSSCVFLQTLLYFESCFCEVKGYYSPKTLQLPQVVPLDDGRGALNGGIKPTEPTTEIRFSTYY